MSIGPAGENLVRYACIMAGIDHSAGHTGLGAVMGSKNLKAICVHSDVKPSKTAPEVLTIVRDYIKDIQKSGPRYKDYSTLGSSGDIAEMNELGVLGTKNYRSGQFEGVEKIDGRNLKSYVTQNITCPRCPVRCKAEILLTNRRHRGFRGGRPEYETIINLGSLCGLSHPESLIHLSNLCNILGVDTISAGSVIAFAMDLYERGILTDEDTESIPFTWGNAESMERIRRYTGGRRIPGGPKNRERCGKIRVSCERRRDHSGQQKPLIYSQLRAKAPWYDAALS